MSKKTYRDLLPVIVERENAVLPEGFDSWGLKSVHPDLTTAHDFKWAPPGGRARSDHNLVKGNTSECPKRPGDGLCVATTWMGMASGGIPARTLLLVAYDSGSVLGADHSRSKFRVHGEVAVVAVMDGWRLLREAGAGANLRHAKLPDADLSGAKLYGAKLRGADLYGADLHGADLRGSDLCGANLRGADLIGAKLYGANLYGADLRDVDLRSADLYGATLRHADLRDADLSGADLYGANLYGADLSGAVNVSLPDGWALNQYGIVIHDEILTQDRV